VLRDTSPEAFTPALGYAANMISLCVLIFLSLVAFIFWLGGLAEKAAHRAPADGRAVAVPPGVMVRRPSGAPVTGD
jgi:hypothetical protein